MELTVIGNSGTVVVCVKNTGGTVGFVVKRGPVVISGTSGGSDVVV